MDLSSRTLRRTRSYAWLRLHIEGLLAVPPVYVFPPWGGVVYVQQTRLGLALSPPVFPPHPGQARAVAPVDGDGP